MLPMNEIVPFNTELPLHSPFFNQLGRRESPSHHSFCSAGSDSAHPHRSACSRAEDSGAEGQRRRTEFRSVWAGACVTGQNAMSSHNALRELSDCWNANEAGAALLFSHRPFCEEQSVKLICDVTNKRERRQTLFHSSNA
jgi:hypothetical protein